MPSPLPPLYRPRKPILICCAAFRDMLPSTPPLSPPPRIPPRPPFIASSVPKLPLFVFEDGCPPFAQHLELATRSISASWSQFEFFYPICGPRGFHGHSELSVEYQQSEFFSVSRVIFFCWLSEYFFTESLRMCCSPKPEMMLASTWAIWAMEVAICFISSTAGTLPSLAFKIWLTAVRPLTASSRIVA